MDPLVTVRAISEVDLDSLVPQEVIRARGLRQPADQQRSMAARALLREVAGGVLGVAAATVRVQTGPHGEPLLPGSSLHVSVTHSGRLVGVALHPAPVGIDLEEITPRPVTAALLGRVCTPAERRWLGPDPHGERFHRLWVRKEALAKSFAMQVEVEALEVLAEVVEGRALRDLDPAPGYAGAVCWDLRQGVRR